MHANHRGKSLLFREDRVRRRRDYRCAEHRKDEDWRIVKRVPCDQTSFLLQDW